MSRKTFTLLLLVVLGSPGCRQGGLSHPPRVRSAEETARDIEIFDAVLPDLIDNRDFSPAVGSRAYEKRQIILDNATSGVASAKLFERTPLLLTPDVRSRLRDDIARRNARGERWSIATYQPADRNVLVRALNDADLDIEFADRFPHARGFVQPWLPGFTDSGQTALFGFYFGPSPHGAVGFYLLKRENGSWTIKQRFVGTFD